MRPTRTILHLYITREMAEAIRLFCARFGITKRQAVRELIKRGMAEAK